MKRFLRGIGIGLAVAFCAVTAHAQEDVVVQSTQGATGFQVGAKAAVVMEAMTGRVLYAQNEHDRLPIASTTKIMTALLALEQQDVDAVFPVDENAIRVEGSSMGLRKGDSASLRALAAGMLLSSGNDGANATAVRIAGSLPAFAEKMNSRAKEIGMENTSFETPSGLDGDNHFSTAYDMALLAREALRNEDFLAICSQYKMRASYGNPPYERWLTNHNKLLNYYEGAIGMKTGFTKKAGRCLVSAARRDGVTLLTVTLNCPDDWTVHQSLFDRFFSELVLEDLAGHIPDLTVPVTGGTAAAVGAVEYESLPMPIPAENPQLTCRVELPPFLYAPITAGQYLGQATIFLEGEEVATLTLTADRDVPLLHPYEEKRSFWEWLAGLFG
jgi:D-alanyl-D-alanine carboxypeptidase/D-alanyl-D-alanine carboxypeptidase (penicillin-binding protein 5/6)